MPAALLALLESIGYAIGRGFARATFDFLQESGKTVEEKRTDDDARRTALARDILNRMPSATSDQGSGNTTSPSNGV
jgi:hypothetical protein